MKIFLYLLMMVLLISGCKKNKPAKYNPSFYVTNINYNNQNFTSATQVCNSRNQQFLSLTGINESGNLVGSILKSASGTLSKDCSPYPIMFKNANSAAIINNNSAYVNGISFDPQYPMVFGMINDNGSNGNISYMLFNSTNSYQITNSSGYDNVSATIGGFIAGVSVSHSNNPQPVLLYQTALGSQTAITLNINNASFEGSLFNIGINANQTPKQLIATGYQVTGGNNYNAIICNLMVNTTTGSCIVVIPSYVDSNTTNMPVNLFIAPDASIIYAVQTISGSNSVVSISPTNPTATPRLMNELTPYNAQSINYVSNSSKDINGNLLYAGAIAVFTSANFGNTQYIMIIDNIGQYKITPISIFLSLLGVANPNNYQFIGADPTFRYLLFKNSASFNNPNNNSILYTVIEFVNSPLGKQ